MKHRDGPATRERILKIAMAEFAGHGYAGGRIDRIARAADVNVRMIYHYFGSKDEIYLAALEATYQDIRDRERSIDLRGSDPLPAMCRLIELTFDFLATDPHFVRLIMSENLMMGQIVKKSETIPRMTRPLLAAIEEILRDGQDTKVFHRSIDAENLYITILGLCFIHISNRHTLGSMFQRDLSDPAWLEKRKDFVVDVVVSYLTCFPAKTKN